MFSPKNCIRLTVSKATLVRSSAVHQSCRKPLIVTLCGANTPVGRIAALLLKQNRLIKELRLHDADKSICGVGMDVSHIDSTTQVRAFVGPNLLKDAVSGSKIIVVAGYSPAKPGETELETFCRNAGHVRTAAVFAAEFAPHAIFCIGCQPINSLVPMISEEYKKAHEYNPQKIIGIGNLVTIRANALIACYTNQDACRVSCPVIGGFCPYSSVCVLSQAKPCNDFPVGIARNIQAKLAKADDDILELKKAQNDKSGCVLSPAFAISRFVTHLTHGMQGCKDFTDFAFVRQTGSIASFLPYMMSVVKLGPNGVESTHMPKISKFECSLLQNASIAIEQSINLGKSYVTGEKTKQSKREPKLPDYCNKIKVDEKSHEFEEIVDFPFGGKVCPSDMNKQKSSQKI